MKKIKEYFFTTFGMLLVAGGMYFFLMPNDLAAGGANGLAQVLNHYIPAIPVGALMIVINIILFILAFVVIGSGFGAKTIYTSLGISGLIWIMEKIYPMKKPFTNDLMLELIFGILISGVGMGVVFNQNASTGGTDITAKILNKFFNIDIGKAVLSCDFIITLMAIFTFGARKGLYALLGVIINGYVIDSIIEGLNVCKNVVIITSMTEEVKTFIMEELGRGATIYYAKGAYTEEDKQVLTTVVGKRQFVKLRNYIKAIDKDAFITVNNVHETFGEGFKNIFE